VLSSSSFLQITQSFVMHCGQYFIEHNFVINMYPSNNGPYSLLYTFFLFLLSEMMRSLPVCSRKRKEQELKRVDTSIPFPVFQLLLISQPLLFHICSLSLSYVSELKTMLYLCASGIVLFCSQRSAFFSVQHE